MKNSNSLILALVFVLMLSPMNLFALSIDAIQVTSSGSFQTQTDIQTWLAGGQLSLIEDFEESTVGWADTLSTDVGTFTAGGAIGTGSTSNPSNHLKFQIRDANAGRINTTPGGMYYLDSADITQITLELNSGLNINKMFFFLSDPGDVGATTSVSSASTTTSITSGQNSGSLWFVGIDAGSYDTISTITWSTGNDTNDGFGLDDFTQVAPVPEPGTLLLLGFGLAGLALYRRRSMNK